MPLGMEVGLEASDIVLDGKPAPPPQKGAEAPNFRPHVCCGQTAAWIKMPLGTKVGLCPGRIVFHWDPSPPPKRDTAPNFRHKSIVAKWCPLPISATSEHLLHMVWETWPRLQ